MSYSKLNRGCGPHASLCVPWGRGGRKERRNYITPGRENWYGMPCSTRKFTDLGVLLTGQLIHGTFVGDSRALPRAEGTMTAQQWVEGTRCTILDSIRTDLLSDLRALFILINLQVGAYLAASCLSRANFLFWNVTRFANECLSNVLFSGWGLTSYFGDILFNS